LLKPIIGALENDMTHLYCYAGNVTSVPAPVPPATGVVDAAIELFFHVVLDQPLKIQESAFAQIAACISDNSLVRNPGRKIAIMNNIVIALSRAFSISSLRAFGGVGHSERIRSLIIDVLQVNRLICLG
jgi:HEAT repeat-containing protein 5